MVYLLKYGENQKIEPTIDSSRLIYLSSFEFSKREDGNETISFDVFDSKNIGDLEEGKIYFVYSDSQLTKQLPCTFRLQNKTLKLDGGELNRKTRLKTITGISIDEILDRKKISFNYKNIKFKTFLQNTINQYRRFVPELSNDFTYIEDLDYRFTIFKKTNITLKETLEIIKGLGFQCFIRPDLKIQAGNRDYNSAYSINFDVDSITNLLDPSLGEQRHILQRHNSSSISETYKELPVTDVVCKAGFSEEGTFTSSNVITNKETNYDLLEKVNIESNFILEGFNTDVLEGFEQSNLTGNGYNKRFVIYDTPLNFNKYQLVEASIQILDPTKDAYFLGLNDGNMKEPKDQIFGFYFRSGILNVIENGNFTPLTIPVKKFLDVPILSVSSDYLEITLDNISDWQDTLEVGDVVSVGGNNSAITLAAGKVSEINSNVITLDTPLTEGVYNSTLRMFRTTTYELRIIVNGNGETEYYIRTSTEEFELVHSALIVYPEDRFITIFNTLMEPTASIGEGIWEVGGYAIDYFFLDKANLIKAYDDQNRKLILSTEQQSDTVLVDAVINNITKNGNEIAQLQFIAPSYIKLILNNPSVPITTSRIPLSFEEDNILNVGMRVLINNEARVIADFVKDKVDGYIDLDQPLNTLPIALDQVWINTSVPANDTNFFIEYVPSREIEIRDQVNQIAFEKFGFNQQEINLSEYSNIPDLAERLRLYLEEETSSKITGNLNFWVDMTDCKSHGHYNTDSLPAIGEYITVNESIQGIINRQARIKAFTIQVLSEGIYNIAIELGEFASTKVVSQLISLKRSLGIVQDNANKYNLNLPLIKRDSLSVVDTGLTITPSEGYPFYSGQYLFNYSGNTGQTIETEDNGISKTVTEGYPFYSGQYLFNYSGNVDYTTYNIVKNGIKIIRNGREIVKTIF